MKTRIKIVSILCLLTFAASCTTLKPFERIYVDDVSMGMGATSGESFGYYVQSIREGGVTAGSGKSGGGCGCN